MRGVVRDSTTLESAVKTFVDAANTEKWHNALNILFINGSVMDVSPEAFAPVLVGLNGNRTKVRMASDLLMGKAKTELAPLVSRLIRVFVPKLLVMVRKDEFVDAAEKGESAVQVVLVASMMSELDSMMGELSKTFIEGAFTLSDMIAVSAFDALCELRRGQVRSALDESDYESMLDLLRRLNVIEPRLQVSLCPECGNYQLTLSRYSQHSEACGRCRTEWITTTLCSLETSLAKLKSDNADFPIFISAYLRNRLAYSAALADVRIHPNAVMPMNGDQVEVDVYLPEYGIAIECKVFEDAMAPLTRSRLGSIKGDLIRQLENLANIGIPNITLATNLPAASATKLKATLLKAAQQKNLRIQNLEVAPGDAAVLIRYLNALSDYIATQISEKMSKSFEKTAPKRLKARPDENGIIPPSIGK